MTVLVALTSSVLWGVSDFFGGKTSRQLPALVVVLISQAAGLVVAFATAAVLGSFSAATGYLPWAVGAGLAGAAAVVMFYSALASGTVGVVAPLAALGVVVPVLIGLLRGSLPSVLCLAGIAVAIGGVVFTAGADRSGASADGHARSVLLASGSAIGFGLLQYAISGGSRYSVVMTMAAMRAISVPLLALAALVAVRGPSGHSGRLQRPAHLSSGLVGIIAMVGIFDVSANLLFGRATVSGALAVVAVLGSLYPAITVLLARIIDGERLSRVQDAGVLTALAGVAMIAVGS